MEKKEMTKLQAYAVKSAFMNKEKAIKEFHDIVDMAAKELKIDAKNENWALTSEMKFFERKDQIKERPHMDIKGGAEDKK